MKIIIAPDSFKGSLSAQEICQTVEEAAQNTLTGDLNIISLPVADGGEGTVDSILAALSGNLRDIRVHNPLGNPITAHYGIVNADASAEFPDIDAGTIAVMEMAEASGLPLVPEEERDVLWSSTFGTGEMVLDALDQGCSAIFIGIGGSATNDGGLGFARALGVRFLDADDMEIDPVPGTFDFIAGIDVSGLDPRLEFTPIYVMSDVKNPLLGPEGATAVYGPQKGVDLEQVALIDAAMSRVYDMVERATNRSVRNLERAGAAGGLGAALAAFTNASMASGVDTVLRLVGFEQALDNVDLVVTGEGRMDSQSAYGKVAAGVGKRCKTAGIPCFAIVGSVGDGAEIMYEHGITSIVPTVDRITTLDEAIAGAKDNCYRAAVRLFRAVEALR